MKTNLFGYDIEDLKNELESLGQPGFRARQIAKWLYQRGAKSFEEMTDLPKSLRSELDARFEIFSTELLKRLDSADGLTSKFLF